MQPGSRHPRLATLLVGALLLSACGGGGGADGSDTESEVGPDAGVNDADASEDSGGDGDTDIVPDGGDTRGDTAPDVAPDTTDAVDSDTAAEDAADAPIGDADVPLDLGDVAEAGDGGADTTTDTPTDTDVRTEEPALAPASNFCAAGGAVEGGGIRGFTCLAPLEIVTTPATDGTYLWTPGPIRRHPR